MERLSKEAERKILDALEEAVRLVDAGETPDGAICKAASAAALAPGHVRMMVHAYNTGKTNAHRKAAADVLAAAADFPLADHANIVRLMYPDEVKAAAAVPTGPPAADPAGEYAAPPTWAGRVAARRREARVPREKVALASGPAAPGGPPAVDPVRAARAEVSRRDAVKRAAEEARLGVSRLHGGMRATADRLVEYFLLPDSEPFADFRKNAELLHGAEAAPLLDHLQARHPLLAKRAGSDVVRPAVGRPYRLFEQALGLARDYRRARETFDKAAAAAAELAPRPPRPQAWRTNALAPGGREQVTPPDEPGEPAGPPSVLRGTPKLAGMFGGAGTFLQTLSALDSAQDIAGKVRLGGKPAEKRLDDMVMKLNDPGHDAELRNIHAEALLADLLNNDEVISGYEPGEVVRLYNDISNIAPRLSNRPMAMRALLRKHLAQGGQVDPYEIDMIAGIENRIKQYEEPGAGAMQQMLVPPSVLKSQRR